MAFAVLLRDGVVIDTARGAANLNPTRTISVNQTREELGFSMATGTPREASFLKILIYLNVSHAATRTRHLFSTSQKQILARFVDLPTPLTPQKVMT